MLYEEDKYFDSPTTYRLAFREFGTCLGIGCHYKGERWSDRAQKILSAWQARDLMASTPKQLQPITMVMFATALLPGGMSKDGSAYMQPFEKVILMENDCI